MSTGTEYKSCTKCGETKPIMAEFFHRAVRAKDGLRSQCKACETANARAYRKAYPERQKASARAWYETHAEQARATCRAWRESHREQARVSTRAWRESHPERAEKARVSYQAWQKAHPERCVAHSAKRRALKNGCAVNNFTAAQWEAMLEYYNHACAYCLRQDVKLTQDHMTPLSRGGDHTEGNIVPACKSCNSRKRNKTLLEFVTVQQNVAFA